MINMKDRPLWIDLDNSPHVPFFVPIIHELKRRGYPVLTTVRDCFQVCALADLHKLPYEKIGRHYGKIKFNKIAGLLIRAMQMVPTVLRERPRLAISHGSRSQLLVTKLLGIPSVVIFDYEFAKLSSLAKPHLAIAPDVIPDSLIPEYIAHVAKYPGIKEDVYVPSFRYKDGLIEELGIEKSKIIVTVRPPATEAHYHRVESDVLFKAVIEWLVLRPGVVVVLLPRNDHQALVLRNSWRQFFIDRKLIIPDHVIDGLNLICSSDLVISGGGTMNREAAALGVPVYSIFRGKIGAVDNFLAEQGRLMLIESVKDIQSKILLSKRIKENAAFEGSCSALNKIVAAIEEMVAIGEGTRTVTSCTALSR